MDFLKLLDKGSLLGIRVDLLARIHKKNRRTNFIKRKESSALRAKQEEEALAYITLPMFCYAVLHNFHKYDDVEGSDNDSQPADHPFFKVKSFERRLRLLCNLFDAIDVDSRGYITWFDLTDFCVRMGHNELVTANLSFGRDYVAFQYQSHPFPGRLLYFSERMQTLFAINAENPEVLYYRASTGRPGTIGIIDPIRYLMREIRANTQHGVMTYHSKKEEELGKGLTKALYAQDNAQTLPHAPTVTCMVAMDKHAQLVFCTRDCYVIKCRQGAGFRVLGHARAPEPQFGIIYNSILDILLTWPGEASDNCFKIWDPNELVIRLKVNRHTSHIFDATFVDLTVGTTGHMHYVASCCMDRKIFKWSLEDIIQKMHGSTNNQKGSGVMETSSAHPTAVTNAGAGGSHTTSSPLDVKDEVHESVSLLGHYRAIDCLVFAPKHEMIIGSGFDLDVYAWDVWTNTLQMKLVGNVHKVASICLAYVPLERAITVDVNGVLKVWNLDKEQGTRAKDLQTVSLGLGYNESTTHAVAAFKKGTTVAILTNKIHFCGIEEDASKQSRRPINEGIGICERQGRLWSVSRNTLTQIRLTDGTILRRIMVLDEEESISDVSMDPKESKRMIEVHMAQKAQHNSDFITATTTDSTGKRLFIGTNLGLVKIYDSYTCRLLSLLSEGKILDNHGVDTGTKESERDSGGSGGGSGGNGKSDVGHLDLNDQNFHGPCVGLKYVDADKLLVALFLNGAIKIYVGVHRNHINPPASMQATAQPDYSIKLGTPLHEDSSGKHLPPRKLKLLRGCDYDVFHHEFSTAVCVSEMYRLIASYSQSGTIRVFDYFSMALLNIFTLPPLSHATVECTGMCFVPRAPIICVCDNAGRITAYSVRPMTPAWVLTWNVERVFRVKLAKSKTKKDLFAPDIDAGDPETGSEVENANIRLTTIQCTWYKAEPKAADGSDSIASGSRAGGVNQLQKSKTSSFIVGVRTFNSDLSSAPDKKGVSLPMHDKGSPTKATDSVSASASASDTSPSPRRLSNQSPSSPEKSKDRRKTNAAKLDAALAAQTKKERREEEKKNCWMLVVGDELGHVFTIDISNMLTRCGALSEDSKPPDFSHQTVFLNDYIKTNLYLGLSPLQSTALSHMIQRPIGDTVRSNSVGMEGLTVKDIEGITKWLAHPGDPIIVIKLIQDRRCFYIHEKITINLEANPPPPYAISTASEDGLVRMWTSEGLSLGEATEHSLKVEDAIHAAGSKADEHHVADHVKTGWSLPLRYIPGTKDPLGSTKVTAEVKKEGNSMLEAIMPRFDVNRKKRAGINRNALSVDYLDALCEWVMPLLDGESGTEETTLFHAGKGLPGVSKVRTFASSMSVHTVNSDAVDSMASVAHNPADPTIKDMIADYEEWKEALDDVDLHSKTQDEGSPDARLEQLNNRRTALVASPAVESAPHLHPMLEIEAGLISAEEILVRRHFMASANNKSNDNVGSPSKTSIISSPLRDSFIASTPIPTGGQQHHESKSDLPAVSPFSGPNSPSPLGKMANSMGGTGYAFGANTTTIPEAEEGENKKTGHLINFEAELKRGMLKSIGKSASSDGNERQPAFVKNAIVEKRIAEWKKEEEEIEEKRLNELKESGNSPSTPSLNKNLKTQKNATPLLRRREETGAVNRRPHSANAGILRKKVAKTSTLNVQEAEEGLGKEVESIVTVDVVSPAPFLPRSTSSASLRPFQDSPTHHSNGGGSGGVSNISNTPTTPVVSTREPLTFPTSILPSTISPKASTPTPTSPFATSHSHSNQGGEATTHTVAGDQGGGHERGLHHTRSNRSVLSLLSTAFSSNDSSASSTLSRQHQMSRDKEGNSSTKSNPNPNRNLDASPTGKKKAETPKLDKRGTINSIIASIALLEAKDSNPNPNPNTNPNTNPNQSNGGVGANVGNSNTPLLNAMGRRHMEATPSSATLFKAPSSASLDLLLQQQRLLASNSSERIITPEDEAQLRATLHDKVSDLAARTQQKIDSDPDLKMSWLNNRREAQKQAHDRALNDKKEKEPALKFMEVVKADERNTIEKETITNKFTRSRYGPYKTRDMLVVSELLRSVYASLKLSEDDQLLHPGEGVMEDDFMFPFDLIVSHQEVQKIDSLISSLQELKMDYYERAVSKRAVLKVLYPHCFEAEFHRVSTFIKANELMRWVLIKEAVPPNAMKTSIEKRGKRTPLTSTAGNVTSSKSKSLFFRHPIFAANGFQGFTISATTLFSAKQHVKKWHSSHSGTFNVQDFVTIIHSMVPRKVLDVCKPLQVLEYKIAEAGTSLNEEVDGDILFFLLQKLGILISSIDDSN